MEKAIKSMEYKAVINILKELRTKSKITQTELTKRIDEPQSFISKYEPLERILNCEEIFDIFNALGINDNIAAKYILDIRRRFK